MSAADQDAAAQMFVDQDMGEYSPPTFVAPGDEAFTLSHEGGEHEAFEDLARQALIYHGYIGCSPVLPTVAVSLRTLASYHQIHRICPRFGIQAQCKLLCHLHDTPYRPYLNVQLTIAYDVYLDILGRVNCQMKKALGRDTDNWRMLNSCPACFYRLEDEPALDFDWLVSIDGNNSLKRWDTSTYGVSPRVDTRRARSDYWLDDDYVDRFKYEVSSRDLASTDPDVPTSFTCVERWRNAGPEQRKRMFSMFHETGIFITSCRHRFVLLACNMVKSGELAKYPLAIISKLISVYGKNGGCAYDIGCAFSTTLRNSSLGPQSEDLKLRMMVGAFHGHAHNRMCQLDWHPQYIQGTGHTEGEGCEHIFAASNELARSTRHATSFHRHQAVEQHFAFWDADKYAALSKYLRVHFEEAVRAISTLASELDVIKKEYNLIDDDFVRFHADERSYLENLKQPAVRDQLLIRYVQILDELEAYRAEWDAAREVANNALTEVPVGNLEELSIAIKRSRLRVDTSYAKLQYAETHTSNVEMRLGIQPRWEIGGEEYKRYKAEATMVKYRAALDELERLVVMRLFELSKIAMSGTGYKLRQQIGKALQRRSETIRNAIIRYNTQAAALNPPRPPISWKDIAEYSFLGEFDLLRHSRADVRDNDWAKPAFRQATVKFFKLQRAREELKRVSVEVRRLQTSIHDEEAHIAKITDELLVSNHPLASELKRQHRSRHAINELHLHRLDQITRHPQYVGSRGVGVTCSKVNFVKLVQRNTLTWQHWVMKKIIH
ncbi:hypothetical protein BKA83DRAFT_4467060 [Pisolithus microcarpus]|nr:hypothetical protein BKA83DRAFT_4467060 [Pisolithus microcarpus]